MRQIDHNVFAMSAPRPCGEAVGTRVPVVQTKGESGAQ